MAGEDVIVSYGADLSALRRDLNSLKAVSEGVGTTLKSSLSGLAAGVGIGAGIAALNGFSYALQESITFMRDSVKAALESELANKRLAETVKAAGSSFSFTFEQLKESARLLQGQGIFSNEQIESAQRVLIQYKLTGEQFRETQRLALDMAADMGTQPVQAAKTLARALADPEKAMRVLRASGISLSEATRAQVASLSESGDIYAAQGAVLKDLQDKYSGLNATLAESATGGWQQVTNTIKDLQSTIGEAFLPYLQEVTTVVRALAQVFADLALENIKLAEGFRGAGWVEEFRDKVVGVIADIVVALQGAIVLGKVWVADIEYMASLPGAGWDALQGGIGSGQKANPAERRYVAAREAMLAARADQDAFQGDPEGWREAIRAQVMNRPTGDGLPDTGISGGGARNTYDPYGKTIGGISDGSASMGASIGMGIANALRATGVVGLSEASDSSIAALAAGIKKSTGGSEKPAFTSGFEDSVSTFKRIQSAQLSTEKVQERQLTALEKLVLQENEKRTRDDLRNTTLIDISTRLKSGVPTVLQ